MISPVHEGGGGGGALKKMSIGVYFVGVNSFFEVWKFGIIFGV